MTENNSEQDQVAFKRFIISALIICILGFASVGAAYAYHAGLIGDSENEPTGDVVLEFNTLVDGVFDLETGTSSDIKYYSKTTLTGGNYVTEYGLDEGTYTFVFSVKSKAGESFAIDVANTTAEIYKNGSADNRFSLDNVAVDSDSEAPTHKITVTMSCEKDNTLIDKDTYNGLKFTLHVSVNATATDATDA